MLCHGPTYAARRYAAASCVPRGVEYQGMNVSIEEIKRDPESVIHRVREGETLVVTERDQPVAEIRPIESVRASRFAASGVSLVGTWRPRAAERKNVGQTPRAPRCASTCRASLPSRTPSPLRRAQPHSDAAGPRRGEQVHAPCRVAFERRVAVRIEIEHEHARRSRKRFRSVCEIALPASLRGSDELESHDHANRVR